MVMQAFLCSKGGAEGNSSIQKAAPAQRFWFRQRSNLLPHRKTAKLLQVISEIHMNQPKQEIQTKKRRIYRNETRNEATGLNDGFDKQRIVKRKSVTQVLLNSSNCE